MSNYQKELKEWISDKSNESYAVVLNAKLLLLKENVIESEESLSIMDDEQVDQGIVEEYLRSKLGEYEKTKQRHFVQELLEVENPVALRVLKSYFLKASELARLVGLYFEGEGSDLG